MRAAIYNGPRSIEVGERPDPVYRAKYRRYARIVDSIVSPKARAATIKLMPS